jgi:hypothetical protein
LLKVRSLQVHRYFDAGRISVEEESKSMQYAMEFMVEIVDSGLINKFNAREASSDAFDTKPAHGRLKMNYRFAHGVKL